MDRLTLVPEPTSTASPACTRVELSRALEQAAVAARALRERWSAGLPLDQLDRFGRRWRRAAGKTGA